MHFMIWVYVFLIKAPSIDLTRITSILTGSFIKSIPTMVKVQTKRDPLHGSLVQTPFSVSHLSMCVVLYLDKR